MNWVLARGARRAVIRFLPPLNFTNEIYREFKKYVIKNHDSNLSYSHPCLTNLGLPDPVDELLLYIKENCPDFDRAKIKNWTPSLHRKINILVVDDPMNPENNGRVFLYDMLAEFNSIVKIKFDNAMYSKKRINPVCPVYGADFVIEKSRMNGYTNYRKSRFIKPAPIAETREGMKAILDQCHDLNDAFHMDSDIWLSYREAGKKIQNVLMEEYRKINAPRPVPDSELDVDELVEVKQLQDVIKSSVSMKQLALKKAGRTYKRYDDGSYKTFKARPIESQKGTLLERQREDKELQDWVKDLADKS